jgi:2,4-dienoyl-CoA reductase-like NADH-dependent reductase (Old Yellow Enzyme family)
MPTLATPLKVGRMSLKTRAVLAPLTRLRAHTTTRVPSALAATYYQQRAAPGTLLISEATYISPETVGTHTAPGVWSAEQVAGWKAVTDAVHSKGGYIYCQLWHIGRVAHTSFNEDPVVKGSGYIVCRSASDVALPGKAQGTFTGASASNTKPIPFSLDDIARLRQDYVKAVRLTQPPTQGQVFAVFSSAHAHTVKHLIVFAFVGQKRHRGWFRRRGAARRPRLPDRPIPQ